MTCCALIDVLFPDDRRRSGEANQGLHQAVSVFFFMLFRVFLQCFRTLQNISVISVSSLVMKLKWLMTCIGMVLVLVERMLMMMVVVTVSPLGCEWRCIGSTIKQSISDQPFTLIPTHYM